MRVALTAGWILAIFLAARELQPRLVAAPAAAPQRDRQRAWAALATAAALLAAAVAAALPPWSGVALAGAMAACAQLTERRKKRRAQERLASELPEIVDLLRIAVGAGLTVRAAVGAAARSRSGALSDAFSAAVAAAEAGGRFADALEDQVSQVGPAVRPLLSVLLATERYGAPAVSALERLASDARADERRRGEAEARKVPVRLLFPLVTCILPAFALLTVAPLIAGGLRALRL